MTERVAFYLRVSTGERTTENQRRELEIIARRRGWDVVTVYEGRRENCVASFWIEVPSGLP
jgi:DNA invertase Pin-like site-specific DNA recombinase